MGIAFLTECSGLGSLKLKTPIPIRIIGDVNNDGILTMADANAVVNYFLATEKPKNFDFDAADVNDDHTITMADANKIVNMFLGQ